MCFKCAIDRVDEMADKMKAHDALVLELDEYRVLAKRLITDTTHNLALHQLTAKVLNYEEFNETDSRPPEV